MASILCFRMHQKTTDTEYGVVHYETESGIVKRPNGKSVEQTLSECVLMEPVVGTQVPGFNIDATSFAGKSYDEVIADAKKNVDAVTLGGMSKDQIIAAVPGYVHPSTKQCSYAYSHPRTKQCSYEYVHPEAKQCNYEVNIDEIVKQVKESVNMGGKLVYSDTGTFGTNTSGYATSLDSHGADYAIIRYQYSIDPSSTGVLPLTYIIVAKGGHGHVHGFEGSTVVYFNPNGNIIFGQDTGQSNRPSMVWMHVELYKY